MTDEELIEMLRNNVGVSEAACRAAREAADRIEALVKERDEAWKRAAHSEKMWGEVLVKLQEVK